MIPGSERTAGFQKNGNAAAVVSTSPARYELVFLPNRYDHELRAEGSYVIVPFPSIEPIVPPESLNLKRKKPQVPNFIFLPNFPNFLCRTGVAADAKCTFVIRNNEISLGYLAT